MNKVAIIILSLVLAIVVGLSGCGKPAASGSPTSPATPNIDDIFLSRWGHTYYNNAPRVSYHPLDIDKLLIQIGAQIPWQRYYKPNVFDCSEMTAYLEYVLERHGYTAEIAHGEVKGIGRHAWVLIYNDTADCWVPVEATSPTGTLDAPIMVLFQWLTGDSLTDYLKPNWKSTGIHDVVATWEYDWWNSPYADQLVAASDKAKLSEPLPPLPEVKQPELPPLPEVKQPELPPLPEVKQPELPPLPEVKQPELPPLPSLEEEED